MRDSSDDHRTDDHTGSEPAASEQRAQTAAAVARMLANPRRVRRA